MSEASGSGQPPAKRMRLDRGESPASLFRDKPHFDQTLGSIISGALTDLDIPAESTNGTGLAPVFVGLESLEAEGQFGITEHVNSVQLGLTGIFKQRYTDFLVNEVSTAGDVLHLTDVPDNIKQASDHATHSITSEAQNGTNSTDQKDPPKEPPADTSDADGSASLKRPRAEDGDDDDDAMAGEGSGKDAAAQLQVPGGGEYLHFSLYKINRDTMSLVDRIARSVFKHSKKGNKHKFTFAGTKDRRGVTVQRVSAHRVPLEKFVKTSAKAQNYVVGDLRYERYPLSLGGQNGNEFIITLRDVRISHEGLASWAEQRDQTLRLVEQAVHEAVESLKKAGYLNYFGRQRFGTYSIKNHVVGKYMLRGDLEAAVEAILSYEPDALRAAKDPEFAEEKKIGRDDAERALAISIAKSEGYKAVDSSLRNRISNELSIMAHLARPNKATDYQGALSAIHRPLRLMYLHAYQSIIWNLAASHRWRTWGTKVQPGDLVLVKEHRDKEAKKPSDPATKTNAIEDEVDQDGDVVIKPPAPVIVEDKFDRARALTAEEANSGQYSIFDIVLPMPGWDVEYPPNMVDFYKETMGKEDYGCLDPFDMRRRWRDASLPGDYRKLIARLQGNGAEVAVREYVDELEQFVETDAERIERLENVTITTLSPSCWSKAGQSTGEAEEGTETAGKGDAEKKTVDGGDATEPADVQNEVTATEQAEATAAFTSKTSATPSGEAGEERVEQTAEQQQQQRKKLAVILKFQLGTSQYATMALREMMKAGLVDFQAEWSGGH